MQSNEPVGTSDDESGVGKDGTVRFLPGRLNRQPIVVLGLTADELWITVRLSAFAGLTLGIPLAILFSTIALAPTCVLIAVTLGIIGGGKLLRRMKRGRPDTWLNRSFQWYCCRKLPLLTSWTGGRDLIVRSGNWTTRRGYKS